MLLRRDIQWMMLEGDFDFKDDLAPAEHHRCILENRLRKPWEATLGFGPYNRKKSSNLALTGIRIRFD